MDGIEKLYAKLKRSVGERIAGAADLDDVAIYTMIDGQLNALGEQGKLSIQDKLELRSRVFCAYRGFGVLEELLRDESISEIMINGPENVFIEKAGQVERANLHFESREQLEDLIQQIVARVNRAVNTANPIVDARLADGSRVHIVLLPVAINGPIITIRKFPEFIGMDKLLAYGALSAEAADFLEKLVLAGYNIFISGGTNSGKTTFLNALSAFIPGKERVITIEDSAELNLRHIANLVSLETKNPNSSGEGAITIAALIKAALRMNPDRIVVGEVRSGEALDMLQAMNTGHDGSLSTGHANSPVDMLSRLETMVLSAADLPLAAIRAQIAGALDIIVHLGRLRDRKRRVLSIVEIGEYVNDKIETSTLYAFEEKESGSREELEGYLVQKAALQNREKLLRAGIRL